MQDSVIITLPDGGEVPIIVGEEPMRDPRPEPEWAARWATLKGKALVSLMTLMNREQPFTLDEVIEPFWDDLEDDGDYFRLCEFIQSQMSYFVVTGVYNIQFVPAGPFVLSPAQGGAFEIDGRMILKCRAQSSMSPGPIETAEANGTSA